VATDAVDAAEGVRTACGCPADDDDVVRAADGCERKDPRLEATLPRLDRFGEESPATAVELVADAAELLEGTASDTSLLRSARATSDGSEAQRGVGLEVSEIGTLELTKLDQLASASLDRVSISSARTLKGYCCPIGSSTFNMGFEHIHLNTSLESSVSLAELLCTSNPRDTPCSSNKSAGAATQSKDHDSRKEPAVSERI
jgi:hypothetical protein